MVFVPEGVFLMGTNDLARPERERPQHEVTLSGYWIDQTEVTNAQYRLCVESGACPPPQSLTNYNDPRYTNFPVPFVTWEAASAYCEEMSRATGLDVRLPTEAQWEKAASWEPFTATKRLYPWGDEPPNPELLRYVESFPALLEGEEVGSYPRGASAYGALDMAGNMQEFVFDWSSEDYYNQPEAAADPQGPAEGSGRVLRGGGWANPSTFASTTRRTVVETATNGEDIGFRCATSTTTLSPENNIAFTPQEALGGAQASVALALAQGQGSDSLLNDWQAALIAMDAQLEAGNNAEVLVEIDSRLETLDVLVETENLPAETALRLRNTLHWVRSQLAAAAASPGEPPAEDADAVGG
jgi:formylglycine-generating enzyme required for sulfatase activity